MVARKVFDVSEKQREQQRWSGRDVMSESLNPCWWQMGRRASNCLGKRWRDDPTPVQGPTSCRLVGFLAVWAPSKISQSPLLVLLPSYSKDAGERLFIYLFFFISRHRAESHSHVLFPCYSCVLSCFYLFHGYFMLCVEINCCFVFKVGENMLSILQ